jgi:hypothetical protein
VRDRSCRSGQPWAAPQDTARRFMVCDTQAANPPRLPCTNMSMFTYYRTSRSPLPILGSGSMLPFWSPLAAGSARLATVRQLDSRASSFHQQKALASRLFVVPLEQSNVPSEPGGPGPDCPQCPLGPYLGRTYGQSTLGPWSLGRPDSEDLLAWPKNSYKRQ